MRSRWFNVFVLVSLVIGLLPLPASAAAVAVPPATAPGQDFPDIEIEPGLRVQMMGGQTAGYLIYFRERPDLSPAYALDWIERGRFVADALSRAAERSQVDVRAYLDKRGIKYQAFWIENVIWVESSNYATFSGLLAFSEIAALRQRRVMSLIKPQRVRLTSITGD